MLLALKLSLILRKKEKKKMSNLAKSTASLLWCLRGYNSNMAEDSGALDLKSTVQCSGALEIIIITLFKGAVSRILVKFRHGYWP